MQKELSDNYLSYKTAYWQEIRKQLQSTLSNYKGIFPDFYTKHLKLIVFLGKDGLVGIYFDRKTILHHKKLDNFLSRSWENKITEIKLFSIPPFSNLSILALVQWLTSDLFNFEIKGTLFNKIPVPNYVTRFPDLFTFDPKTGNRSKNKNFFVIKLKQTRSKKIDNLKDCAICIRDLNIEDYETSQKVFSFLWREIDIYGEATLCNLNETEGRLQANRDILAIIGSHNVGIRKNEIKTNPESKLIEKLNDIIVEFRSVLDNKNSSEHDIQAFLKNNPILFMPDYLRCIPHPQFGSEYEPDFILVGGSNSGEYCVLVEIEAASHKLFNKNGDPSAALKHAEKQIRDWRAWLRDNASYAKRAHNLENLHSNSPAEIVIGRRSSLQQEGQLSLLQALNADYHGETIVKTYDDLIDSTLKWIENIKKIET